MLRRNKKNAHKAAGNLLISANYLSRGTSGGLKGFVSACERSKIEARSRFVLLSQKLIRKVIMAPRRMTAQGGPVLLKHEVMLNSRDQI